MGSDGADDLVDVVVVVCDVEDFGVVDGDGEDAVVAWNQCDFVDGFAESLEEYVLDVFGAVEVPAGEAEFDLDGRHQVVVVRGSW